MIDHVPRFDINLSILFTELPLLERPAAAAASGFEAVEFWWPFPDPVPQPREVDAFVGAIDRAGVRLVGLNCWAGDMPAGDRGVVSTPGLEDAFAASIDVLVSIAGRTGCRLFNALYGQRVAGVDPGEQGELAVRNLGRLGEAVAPLSGVVLLEPLALGQNGAYPLATAEDVLDVADRVRAASGVEVRLLADLYHLTSNGADLDHVLRTHHDRVGHVQIADSPGRHEPGTGEIDFSRTFDLLAELGYDGYVGLEYRPSTSSADSFGWMPAVDG